MRDQVIDILKRHVDKYGFVRVAEYKRTRDALGKQDLYADYRFLDGFETIITLAIPYPTEEVKWKKKGYGRLSRYSYATDYHIVFGDILKRITTELNEIGIRTKASVDTGGVDERWAGHLSNMGWLGKNQFLIIEDYGTYSFLATILVDVPLDTEHRLHDDCGDCRKCIDACPSGALDEGFNQDLCISHLSQEKIPLTDTEIGYFKTMIYGCDICMKACPKNTGIDIHKYDAFEPTGIENVHLKSLLHMTNKEYMAVYGNNASSWRGASVIKRNALAMIYNHRLYHLKDDITASMETLKDNPWYLETAKLVLKKIDEKEQFS